MSRNAHAAFPGGKSFGSVERWPGCLRAWTFTRSAPRYGRTDERSERTSTTLADEARGHRVQRPFAPARGDRDAPWPPTTAVDRTAWSAPAGCATAPLS